MAFSPKVWGDALRRLQDEIPDFAFDAWIAPLVVKVTDGHVVLGCQSSFHRDRVRNHYADVILDCWRAARSDAGSKTAATDSIEPLTMKEFGAANGQLIEAHEPVQREASMQASTRTSMRRVVAGAVSTRAVTAYGAAQTAIANVEPVNFRPKGAQHVPGDSRAAGSNTNSPRVAADHTATLAIHAVPEPKPRKQSRTTRSDSRSRAIPLRHSGGDAGRDAESGPVQPQLPFSFESFIVGPCNALAREAALALARRRSSRS